MDFPRAQANQMRDADLQASLRQALRGFQRRNSGLALLLIGIDFVAACALAAMAVAVEAIWLKALFVVASGMVISTLFVLGHDAAHNSLSSSRALNAVLARLAFLPSLHNVTLWSIQHNRIHHQVPNVRGLNSWSPLALDEYRQMSAMSRAAYRLYRSGFGMAPYYLVNRWWRAKFFPRADVDPDLRRRAWYDFAILVAWSILWSAFVVWLGGWSGGSSPIAAVGWGFLGPFLVWNQLMGLTTLLQHTNPAVAWYRSADEARDAGGQELRTVHVRCPRWYGLVAHEIMEHPAHHLNPMIPCYRLRAAQTVLNEILGPAAKTDALSPWSLVAIVRLCKLYDYDRHLWIDFDGRPTSDIHRRADAIPEAAPRTTLSMSEGSS